MKLSSETIQTVLTTLLPDHATLELETMTIDDARITVTLRSCLTVACCPVCCTRSHHRHSQYLRTLQDLPWGRCTLRLRLFLQKFRCRVPACIRTVFAESIPTIALPRVRRTTAVTALMTSVGLRMSGTDGARILQQMGLTVSSATLLRTIRQLPLPPMGRVRIVGIDDWSWRKGQRFGTMLVDLEQHQVVALLPDRTPESTARWLATQPSITTVSRDRSEIYADGIRQGAPQAIHVADRWHLMKNLSDTLERFLIGQRSVLRTAASAVHPTQAAIPHDPSPYGLAPRPAAQERAETLSQQQHGHLIEAYTQVHHLHAKGADLADIARVVGISRRTVYRYLAMPLPPERKHRQMGPTAIVPFIPYLTTRWNEGCHNGMRLWRELRQQEYPHSAAPVLRFIHAHLRPARVSPRHPVVTRRASHAPTARQVARCWIRDATTWTPAEQAYYRALVVALPLMETAYDLTTQFVSMVRNRTGTLLDAWLSLAHACAISAFRGFAQSLKGDHAAVQAGLTLEWNNGQLEGQINRLKLLKRQSYGRAGFDLLQRRVMLKS